MASNVMRAMGVSSGSSGHGNGMTSSSSYTNLLGLGNAFIPGSGGKSSDSVNNTLSSGFVFPATPGEESRGSQSPGVQALNQGSPPGILINSTRISRSRSPASHSPASPSSYLSSSPPPTDSSDHLSPLTTPFGSPVTYSHKSRASLSDVFELNLPPSKLPATFQEDDEAFDPSRGRTSTRPPLGESTTSSLSTSTTATNTRSIRFAPLPEIRTRSYSTGRNIWLEDADVTDSQAGDRRFIRKDTLDQQQYDLSAAEAKRGRGSFGAESGERMESPTRASLWGSWKNDLGISDKKENTGSDGGREDASGSGSGYGSTLLTISTFGLVKKKKSSHRKTASNASGSEVRSNSLSRVSSNESEISGRGSMDQSRPTNQPTNSGVPMRKTRTWEPESQQSRRAQYPPVAQRSKKVIKLLKPTVKAPDPVFVEWGYSKAGSGGGGLGSVKKLGYKEEVDTDDGSGMAWVKRRRAEKEAREKKEREEALIPPELIFTEPPVSSPNSGTTTPTAQSALASRPILNLVTPSSSSAASEPDQPTSELSLATIQPASDVTVTPPTPASTASSTSNKAGSSYFEAKDEDAGEDEEEEEEEEGSSTDVSSTSPLTPLPLSLPLTTSTTSKANSTSITSSSHLVQKKNLSAPFPHHRSPMPSPTLSATSRTDSISDDEDEVEVEGEEEEEEEDSDLDEEELAIEEAETEKARISAMGAGSEKYQTATHQTRLMKVE